ncbi:MAG: hypothetical protein LBQ38_02460 [Spirochaetaceae bacterium]|nr:hypothetical protein [Spirochaetaceae bacterium]
MSEMIKMTVTNSEGKTRTDTGETLIGTYGYVGTNKDPYRFYASASPDTTNPPVKQVMLVLPWGGVCSGAYRYPKIGEQVLAANGLTQVLLMCALHKG